MATSYSEERPTLTAHQAHVENLDTCEHAAVRNTLIDLKVSKSIIFIYIVLVAGILVLISLPSSTLQKMF